MPQTKDIHVDTITDAVARMCIEAACDLPQDVEDALKRALNDEDSDLGLYALNKVCENARMAREEGVPLCQDTGMVVVFCEIGADVRIIGGLLEDAVNRGVARGYTDGYLRKSTVVDPLFDRSNACDNTPAIVHVRFVEGDQIALTVLPKGAGSENMSALGMLKPAQGVDGVVRFVVDAVVRAGGNPCPPSVVGVGIGGNAEKALELSKEALRREIGSSHPDSRYAELERRILHELNATGIGPQGFGGTVTSLAVHIASYPTHIAMLPVGVTINCHAARHKKVVL
ncbi:MAG: fumarate hydratase [Eggerthellaceae bacterium]|nr:fumarate hydratase [Eggerthellaceae bacterium]